ncbi:hypothetical protein O2K51_08135 [Apibacter raozihei]|uniref:hypothetical protein n=1 Tax=Apibacter raozihei TaxID=2500547 RepID=UPI000FE3061F|nr:hypothetical protein [Apibacter raozihei]
MKKLLDYIQGDRRGKDAHEIERNAMTDPFLQDALDGYDSINGDHLDTIKRLQSQINQKTKTKKSYTSYLYIAASIVVLFSIGALFLLYDSNNQESTIAYQLPQDNKPSPSIMYEHEPSSILKSERTAKIYNEKKEKTSTYSNKNKNQSKPNKVDESLALNEPLAYLEPSYSSINKDDISTENVPDVSEKFLRASPIKKLSRINERRDNKSLDGNLGVITTDSALQQKGSLSNNDLALNKDNKEQYPDRELLSLSKSAIIIDNVQYEAVPVIGNELYNEYLKEQVVLSKEDKCYSAKGVLILHFSVSEKGVPNDFKIVKSLCKSLDNNLIKAIKKGSLWTAGKKGEIIFER